MRPARKIHPVIVKLATEVHEQPKGLHLTLNAFRIGGLQGCQDLATMAELTDDTHLRL